MQIDESQQIQEIRTSLESVNVGEVIALLKTHLQRKQEKERMRAMQLID